MIAVRIILLWTLPEAGFFIDPEPEFSPRQACAPQQDGCFAFCLLAPAACLPASKREPHGVTILVSHCQRCPLVTVDICVSIIWGDSDGNSTQVIC